MKAFVFPGFDSLEIRAERELSLRLPCVQESLQQVQYILRKNRINDVDLTDYILADDIRFNSHLGLKVVSSVAVQIGVFNQWKASGHQVDFIMGCSLGDLARTVCAGIVDLEPVICGGYEFGESLMARERGEIYKFSSARPITVEELEHSLPASAHVAVFQTPKHFLIAGEGREFREWIKQSQEIGYRIYKMADIPLHSPLMQDVSEIMQRHICSADVKIPITRVISSVWCREIFSREEFTAEISDNIVSKVDWVASMKLAVEEMGVNEIVSLGPASTLLRFSERIPLQMDYLRTDAFKILTENYLEIA